MDAPRLRIVPFFDWSLFKRARREGGVFVGLGFLSYFFQWFSYGRRFHYGSYHDHKDAIDRAGPDRGDGGETFPVVREAGEGA